ncbi:MAG: DUF4038 domain-containing protein [Terracidiphilus sp.]
MRLILLSRSGEMLNAFNHPILGEPFPNRGGNALVTMIEGCINPPKRPKMKITPNYPKLRLAALLTTLTLLGCQITAAQMGSSTSTAAFPLKLSANHRYLVDQNDKPFLMVGDTPQGLMSRLNEEDADIYFADRQAHGFNAMGWIDTFCAGRDFPEDEDGSTVDGIRPFTGYVAGGTDYEHYDLSKPNEAYFARLDHILTLAAKHGILIFINPIETIGWLPTLRNNGLAADYAFGKYLGNRYKEYSNVAWISGNDFVTWKNPTDDELVEAVAKGIKSAAPEQLQTVELNYNTSSSFDDSTWVPIIDLNGTYTYSPTYMQMLDSYNQKPVAPAYLLEAHYDQENVGNPPDYGTPPTLRREEYWAMLTGAMGQFYGNYYTWSLAPGWQSNIDTKGVEQLTIWNDFFSSLPWYELVPDQDHSVVTGGLGTYGDFKTRVSHSDYCTAARTQDGSYVLAYVPTARTITVNMGALKASASAEWFDPTDGTYRIIPGTFVNQGTQQFTPPEKNHEGASDWVFVLNASGSSR